MDHLSMQHLLYEVSITTSYCYRGLVLLLLDQCLASKGNT